MNREAFIKRFTIAVMASGMLASALGRMKPKVEQEAAEVAYIVTSPDGTQSWKIMKVGKTTVMIEGMEVVAWAPDTL